MNRPERIENDTAALMRGIGEAAKTASRRLGIATPEEKNNALKAAAKALRAATPKILEANVKDVEAAKAAGRPASFVDRLLLDEKRVAGIAKGLEEIAELPDPIGTVLAEWTRPNGLKFQRVRVPLGTIGIIYESRPNVTADAGALSLKAGNASILRGGSESHHSSVAIHACLVEGLRAAGLPEAAIQLVPTTDREAVGAMLRGLDGAVDVIVPRGGKSLVQRVQEEARVPVFAHLEGICHTYVDKAANIDMALAIVVNAKMRRTGVCGATECLLIDKNAKSDIVTPLVQALLDEGCEVRGDAFVQKADPRVKAATAEDYGKEFLEPIIAVKMVDGVDEAIEHIARYGSQHTDAIITDSTTTGERFLDRVDSAIVLVNASTQFADGGEFG
ncbi:MAG: glutamate-5-semialdehyde dehydrogenase, partial [Hyphomicrobium sp.]|nr:glutamate-5-semialdehyde dehydrogenase [Hyphomicrobium sp.]